MQAGIFISLSPESGLLQFQKYGTVSHLGTLYNSLAFSNAELSVQYTPGKLAICICNTAQSPDLNPLGLSGNTTDKK